MPLDPAVFVHERALCESETVGAGTRVWAFAHVMEGAVIGSGCNICGHAFIEAGAALGDRVTVKNGVMVWDKVVVEDDVFLGPGTVLTNDLVPRATADKSRDDFLPTLIRHGATVGANATIVCGVTIGRSAFVGAGTVVVSDVPDHALVVGNPARRIGWMCVCGERLGDGLACKACERSYETTASGLRAVD